MSSIHSEKPIRKRNRLPDFDYSQQGAYFVTIVTRERMCLFGGVFDGKIVINKAGSMINKTICGLSKYIPKIQINNFIVMPNHIHLVILFDERIGPAQHLKGVIRGSAPTGIRFGLPAIVSRFKSITTTRYIKAVKRHVWPRFDGKLWQRGYYEHVIRNERDHQAIVDYIAMNPLNWEKDDEYIGYVL